MPTILRPWIIHQPDRSQTSKKLADSSKPIAMRRSLTLFHSFQITRALFRFASQSRACVSLSSLDRAFLQSRVYASHACIRCCDSLGSDGSDGSNRRQGNGPRSGFLIREQAGCSNRSVAMCSLRIHKDIPVFYSTITLTSSSSARD